MTIAIILILLTAGCFSPPGQRGPEGETKNRATEGLPSEKIVRVVATIFPLADIIKQIGGEAVEVATLLTPGSSPHTFEPTVEQARAVSEADLMVFVGGGLDNWAVKLGTAGEKTVLLEIMALLAKEEDSDAAFTDNPHIWVDPVLVKERIAPLICRAL
jgi:zinc transport system substrate-binding protein